jgi:protein-L-isoaspartate(D-aspartate) O-methyltransferase
MEPVTDPFADARQRLLDEIAAEAEGTVAYTGRRRYSERVMAAMARVPRHAFVPAADQRAAYDNRPLPIGHGQTISQPYIVALMTELLDLAPGDRVLEIGTGCGYQAAVLAEVAGQVWSVETIPALADAARRRLADLGYGSIAVKTGDGFLGWPEHAPYDGIIVTAAPVAIPPALVEQLAVGGRLVIPVGPEGGPQVLNRCVRRADGGLDREGTLPVAFVPMVPAGRRRA